MNSEPTFLWHDYETFGTHPRFHRPAQFAALRTSMGLEPVGEPLSWHCQPATDVLPHPLACLVTGITPQLAREKGVSEAEFAARIHAEMMEPGTCAAGYNSIRFDDEFSRNLFYRNLYDPYEREWRNNNSRWDLIDLARMCYALRPDGIEWPEHEPGMPSFRLEDLSAANGIEHTGAHEALADVMATIALARLVRARQPRLFDWALGMRDAQKVLDMLGTAQPEPLLHTSSRFPASRGCTSLVLPITLQPDRPKWVVVFDLATDPEPLIGLDADEVHDRVFTPTRDLPEDVERIALKTIKANAVPMVAPAATLKGMDHKRIGLDVERCYANADKLRAVLPSVRAKVMDVFKPLPAGAETDPDHMIYHGFFPDDDRKLMARIRRTPPAQLATARWPFTDPRLEEMLFRYRARNYPDTLDADEMQRWQAQRKARLETPVDDRLLTPRTYALEIEAAREKHADDRRALALLDQLEAWGAEICPA
ncbi:MAG: exodeoxyribonuclease I [Lysobacterales bacterium]|jgi:exodeoxyribonuclease-1